MKVLIVGLGNIGEKYANTRHNIGFLVLDALAKASNTSFSPDRYGDVAEFRHKGRKFVLVKPSTYMNLSGKAVRYWMQKEKVGLENLLVVSDDLALEFGQLRMKGKGSDGGHNGFKNIQDLLGTTKYPRLRFGIGSKFSKGHQVNYVLSDWTAEETQALPERIEMAAKAILSFGTIGIARTMNEFNNK